MNKKIKIIFILVVLFAIGVFIYMKVKPKSNSGESITEISPTTGSIQNIVSTTGTVLPKNRLEIKPPVNGRVESILVQEGDTVKTGQTLAWMSSTERAALLDAARGQGEAKLKYWQETYKPIALLAPINGEVIVATTQPGQTVTTADAVVVLSDQLIVRAQVDETDIGKVFLGQSAIVSLDAYPENKIKAKVEHIYYESETVNNVTIYKVDLLPEGVPSFFRSGMNATIEFIILSTDNALILPLEAIHKEKDESYVLLKKNGASEPVRQVVKIGLTDEKNAEIISGISEKDRVILKTKKFVLPTSEAGSSPFTPFGTRRGTGRR